MMPKKMDVANKPMHKIQEITVTVHHVPKHGIETKDIALEKEHDRNGMG
jgi:hypothetical protein